METANFKTNIRQISNLLKYTYGIVPIVAGLDKFVNLLAQWEKYIPSGIMESIPFSAHTFMIIIGVIEIIAGIIVLTKPLIGGYIVAAWLTLIGIILLIGGIFPDVAVRDFVMAIGAFSMAKITRFIS